MAAFEASKLRVMDVLERMMIDGGTVSILMRRFVLKQMLLTGLGTVRSMLPSSSHDDFSY